MISEAKIVVIDLVNALIIRMTLEVVCMSSQSIAPVCVGARKSKMEYRVRFIIYIYKRIMG